MVKYVKKDLRQGGKKFNKSTEKRGKIKVGDRALCIGPHSVNERKEYGHYEIDTILSKRPSLACLVTIIERKTRYLYACRLDSRCSKDVCDAIVELMRDLSPKQLL